MLHPWKASPVASEIPSGQHPKYERLQSLVSSTFVVFSNSVTATSVESGTTVVTSTIATGNTVVVVTTMTGQPSFSKLVASVTLSEQQPNNELAHKAGGHPFFVLSRAGDIPSEQHPNLVSLHVFGVGHPSSNGPLAAVLLSTAQHPNSVKMQGIVFGLTRHLRGFCSSSKMVVSLSVVSSSESVVEAKSVVSVMSVSLVVVKSVVSVTVEALLCSSY